MDDSKTVGEFLKDKGAKLVSFTRYEVGEGIEKKQEDFAAEVREQMKQFLLLLMKGGVRKCSFFFYKFLLTLIS